MFQITLLFLYLVAAVTFAWGRLRPDSRFVKLLHIVAFVTTLAGIVLHTNYLLRGVFEDGALSLSLPAAASLIGLQLAIIALFAAIDPALRGMSAGLLLLASPAAFATHRLVESATPENLTWQLQTHVFSSMFAYGLLTAGAIVAIYALVQDRRLRAARISAINKLFAPLETTERLLFAVSMAGFIVLAMSVITGMTFIENLFAQHLVHKTVLSLLALVLFGVLVAGRILAGWRGRRAVYLYLAGFALLCLAYFGSRVILEVVLGRHWG